MAKNDFRITFHTYGLKKICEEENKKFSSIPLGGRQISSSVGALLDTRHSKPIYHIYSQVAKQWST